MERTMSKKRDATSARTPLLRWHWILIPIGTILLWGWFTQEAMTVANPTLHSENMRWLWETLFLFSAGIVLGTFIGVEAMLIWSGRRLKAE